MIIPTSDPALPSQPQAKPAKRVMRTRSQWQTVLDDFNRSGLSKVAYCKQHGIATSSLNRWQRILQDECGGADFINVTEPLSIAPATPSPTCDSDKAWQVELALGAGIVLRLRTV
jgi:transposase-like protein